MDHDNIDEEDFEDTVDVAPRPAPLPAPARDPNGPQLVTGETGGQKWFDYVAAGGAKTFARCGAGLFDSNDPDGRESDFVLLRQDTSRQWTLLIGLGPGPTHITLCRFLGSPSFLELTPKRVAQLVKGHLPLDGYLVRTRIVLPAGSPGIFVPSAWRRAIRTERDGVTVAGLAPLALFGTETRESAPPVHHALLDPADRQAAPAVGRRRRAT